MYSKFQLFNPIKWQCYWYLNLGHLLTNTLYKKETDRNQYLLTSSCHPSHVTYNIPFSLALRIVRICSKPEAREKKFLELKQMLLDRDYPNKIIDAAIEKARNIPRNEGKYFTWGAKTSCQIMITCHSKLTRAKTACEPIMTCHFITTCHPILT